MISSGPDALPAGDARVLELPPEASSAARARRHVRRALDGLPEDVVANAELCVTELVTNALLHAGTPVLVRVEHGARSVRLVVADGSPEAPQWVPRSLTATTGRGLALITALSTSHGVEVRPDGGGKEVWCEMSAREAAEVPAVANPDDLLAGEWASVLADLEDLEDPAVTGSPDGPAGEGAPAAAAAPPVAGGDRGAAQPPIRLLRYPLRTGVRMREHREAVLRELRLLGLAGTIPDPGTAAVVERVTGVLSTVYGGHLPEAEALKLQALAAGRDCVDLEYPRLPDHERVLAGWRAGIEALEALSDDPDVAVPEPPPGVPEMWAWVVEEFARQLRGEPPRPWHGPLD